MEPHAPKREFYRLPDTPVTATYGASVNKELRVWLIAAFFVEALALVVGFIVIVGMFTGEGAKIVIRGGDRRRAVRMPNALVTCIREGIRGRPSMPGMPRA
jgi:hypothetical protein